MSVLERYPHPRFVRLVLQQRSDSRFFQAVTYLDGALHQWSTRSVHLPTAFKLAEDWYRKLVKASLDQSNQHPIDQLVMEPIVADVYRGYLSTLPKPKQAYASMRMGPIAEFWRTRQVKDIDARTFREFYAWRRRRNKTVSNSTLKKDVALIRSVLHHAVEETYIETFPNVPKVGTVVTNPRPWLTPAEWKTLVTFAERRIVEAADAPNPKLAAQRLDLLDLMQFLVLSMCRVGEVLSLHYVDCRIEGPDRILIAHVTGKRGARTIVAPRDAAKIIERRLALTDDRASLVFPTHHRDAFRELLKAADLYTDSSGFTRNMKSLRATAISFRLLEPNPNLLMIARNAGTSLAMIDTFYAKRLSAEMHRDLLSAPLVQAGDTF
jgi:integrase